MLEIDCPQGGDNVLVVVQGSGSGAQGTICVRGVVTDREVPERLLASGQFVRVRILAGMVAMGSLGSPDPPQAW
jgi:hypothetical protein